MSDDEHDGGDYKVGYKRPPVATRFRKGQSGNPKGRRPGSGRRRTADLLLQEAYRPVTVREGERIVKVPAIQAILRAQIALAAKGNGPAQRALLQLVQAAEAEILRQAQETQKASPPMSDFELARRLHFVLAGIKARRDQAEQKQLSARSAEDEKEEDP